MTCLRTGVLFISAALVFISCASFQVSPDEYTGSSISFGNGGGFAGHEQGHTILDNGEVFKMDHKRDYSGVKVLSSNVTNQIFKNVDFLQLVNRPLMRPGNTYRFIEVNYGGKTTRISWNDVSKNAPEDIMIFYNILTQHAQ